MKLMIMTTLGESVLIETLKSAAYFITHVSCATQFRHYETRHNFHESRYCYLFVQGTGLDMLIQRFGLEYDPNELRTSFNFYLKRSI